MEHWQMNKLGFVNFWLYDCEEFPFRSGRLLLRGENGAGKSVTTQSFIPFMLDGDMRPTRLDSFGSKDRKMEYYLLGEDGEDSTGYLYLEFVKPQARLYRTLVIGLRARRGKSMEFWGFCLNDGRRVGELAGDFPLFKVHGLHRAPLSKQEVRNQLNSADSWTEKSSDYKRMVNRMIFGYVEDAQYDRLLKLLIQIRKPKLSKDFSPTTVQAILNESLQPLSENDVAPLVSSMEKMDDIEERLANLKKSYEAAQRLRVQYIRYNQFVLGKKGEQYLDARATADKKRLQKDHNEEELDRNEAQFAAATQNERFFAQEISRIESQKAELAGTKELKDGRKRIEVLENKKQETQLNVQNLRKKESRLQEDINQKQRQQAVEKRNYEAAKYTLNSEFSGFSSLNETLQFPFHPSTLKNLDPTTQGAAALEVQQCLRKAADLLRKYEEGETELGNLEEARDTADRQVSHQKDETNRAQAILDRTRNELCEALACLENDELLFSLDRTLFQQLTELVLQYEGLAEGDRFQSLFAERWEALKKPIEHEKQQQANQRFLLQQEYNDLHKRLVELESQQELPPVRSSAVLQTRKLLESRGIPHAAFYELVDFAPGLAPERCSLLETQLLDAGLLDALVLHPEDYGRAQDLLKMNPDRFLCTDGRAPTKSAIPLVPEASRPEWAESIGQLLRCISDIPEGDLYFAPDGSYRQGSLQGGSCASVHASYIGVSARKANRQRHLAELKSNLEEKSTQLQEVGDAIAQIQKKLKDLENEYKNRPTTADLAQAFALVSGAQTELDRAQAELDTCQGRVSAKRTRQSELRSAWLPLTKKFSYSCTSETYCEMEELCMEYRAQLQHLHASNQVLEMQKSTVARLEDEIAAWEDQSVDQHDEVVRAEAALRDVCAQMDTLRAYLESPETRALIKQLDDLDVSLRDAQESSQKAHDLAITCSTNLNHLRPSLETYKQELTDALLKENHLCEIFAEEYHKAPGHTENPSSDLLLAAQKARDDIRKNDQNQMIEALRTSLEKNIQNCSGDLADYRVEMISLFNIEDGVLRGRAAIQLHMGGTTEDLLDFVVHIKSQIDADEQLLSEEDRRLFETILNKTITVQLRNRIDDSEEWVRRMSETMGRLNTSMGLRFSLSWKGKPAMQQQELKTSELVALLRKDSDILSEADQQSISAHFRAKVASARTLSRQEDAPASYADLVRNALDFRNWFEFHLYYQKAGENKKDLTNSAFNSFSGGEKAMAMYVPLFAALSSQYEKSEADSPRLLALDEAFAGVDDKNIESMFKLVHELGFGYIMNSQVLWGCYPAVNELEVAELWRPQNAVTVTVALYYWNGSTKQLEDV